MPTKLPDKAVEGSTFGIRADFFDRSPGGVSTPFTPNTGLTWDLRDADGAIVNEKEDEPISEAESVYIVLSGADLALVDNHPVERFVTIKGTYDSALGNDLPLIDEVSFQIKNLVGEPQA